MVILVVAGCCVAGFGAVSHRRQVVAQIEIVAAHRQQVERLRVARAREYALAFTYSSVSPVDCARNSCLALTFDDGPNPMTTPQVLQILEHEHIRASFFVVGSRVAGNRPLLRRMFADGDEIGNHSWTHPDFTTLSAVHIQQQIALTQSAISAAGVPVPTLFRPPYGAVDKEVVDNVPLAIMLWNEDPRDWAASSPQQVESAVEASAQPGGIVDMHDIYHMTASALDPIIKKLKGEQYQFVTVSQLLDLKPGQKGEFYGRP
jgi:peptidoglycan/xylan/chitin deacetylase (PgdA/CDA1 family)